MQGKHITLLERNPDSDSPMIGTLTNIDKKGITDFTSRVESALREHFDAEEDYELDINQAYTDILASKVVTEFTVVIDDNEYTIDMVQTWLY